MPFTRTLDPNMPDKMRPVGAPAPTPTPTPAIIPVQPSEEKSSEQFATIAEVQALVNSLVNTIKSGFSTKTELSNFANSFNARYLEMLQKYPSKDEVAKLAKDAVPVCLRGLDGSQRQGNVLMLQPGQSGGQDSTYFGTVKAGGGLDLSKVALGFTISGTTVTILAGEIDRIAVVQASVTVANDNYVYVRRAIASDTMIVLVGASVPANDATFKYYRLYQFTVTGTAPNEVATMKFALRPFDIETYQEDILAEKMSFAIISITGTSVTLQAGTVVKGTNVGVEVPSQSITVADGQIIYVVYSLSSGTASLGVSNTFPQSASGDYKKALHKMNVVVGVASLNFTYHKGVVQIDGVYS